VPGGISPGAGGNRRSFWQTSLRRAEICQTRREFPPMAINLLPREGNRPAWAIPRRDRGKSASMEVLLYRWSAELARPSWKASAAAESLRRGEPEPRAQPSGFGCRSRGFRAPSPWTQSPAAATDCARMGESIIDSHPARDTSVVPALAVG